MLRRLDCLAPSMSHQVLHYRRAPTERPRPRPLFGGTSCVLAAIGLGFVCLPVGGHVVLNVLGPWGFAYFVIGAAIGAVAVSRAEAPGFAVVGVCIHVLTAAIWFQIGGWAYFFSGP